MKHQCVVGVFDSLEASKLAVGVLGRGGFAAGNVSLVTRHVDPTTDVGNELEFGDDSLPDAAIGATLGGLIGVLGDATLFMLTGIGTILIAGPLVTAVGAIVGGLVGAMEGWGIHKLHIRKYENLVREGKVLLVVDGNPIEIAEADRMLRETEATEVHRYAQSSDDAPEIDDRH